MSFLLRRAMMASGVITPSYATWNPSDKSAGITLSNGNLSAATSTTSRGVRSTVSESSGKWYVEITKTVPADIMRVGVGTGTASLTAGVATGFVHYQSDTGEVWKETNNLGAFTTMSSAADVLGIALDATGKTVKFYVNNTLQTTVTYTFSNPVYILLVIGGTTTVITANFGATALTYAPPAGYSSGLF